MVTITRGNHSITVTRGAFLRLYKPMGYVITGAEEDLTASPAPGNETTPVNTQDVSEDDLGPVEEDPSDVDEDDLDEKPLSEMTFRELKRYAHKLGITANGMSSRKEVRTAINKALAEG